MTQRTSGTIRSKAKSPRDEIATLQRGSDPGSSFFCAHDLKSIWADKQKVKEILRHAFDSKLWSSEQLEDHSDIIQEKYYIILSIMVFMKATKSIPQLYDRLQCHNPAKTDEDLPLDNEDLTALSDADRVQFLYHQPQFLPIIIQEPVQHKIITVDTRKRLPLVYKEQIGSGSYGKITTYEIPPRYLKDQRGWNREQVWIEHGHSIHKS